MGIDSSKKLPKKKIAEQRWALQNIFVNSFLSLKALVIFFFSI